MATLSHNWNNFIHRIKLNKLTLQKNEKMSNHNIEDTILEAINQMSLKLSLTIGFILGSLKHLVLTHTEDLTLSFFLGVVGALGGVFVKLVAHYISKWNNRNEG